MIALRLAKEQQLGNKELGTVWIDCSPALFTLRTILESQAEAVEYFDCEHRPRGEGYPSLIVVCLEDNEDAAKKVKQSRALAPKTPILAFTSSTNVSRLAEEALRAGASGFVHARMRSERLALAISSITEDEVLIPRELLGELLGRRLFLRLPKFLDP